MESFFTYIIEFYFKLICILQTLWKKYSQKDIEKPIVPKIETIKDITEKYVEKHKTKFLKTFDSEYANKITMNFNIDTVYYSKKQFQEMLKDVNNPLEKQWKTRLLFETTPRGNIIMFYDPYKLGFAYYCDQSLPYDIINAVAMKYVVVFQCQEFFMDEHIVPENKPSPLLKLLEEDKPEKTEEKNKETVSKNEKGDKEMLKSGPFAKFKNYNNVSSKISENKKDSDKKEKQKERNRFINLGKICNFKLLQPPPKKKTSPVFTSHLVNDLFENSDTQKQVFSYRDFKQKLKTT
jgi:hypothetical protein